MTGDGLRLRFQQDDDGTGELHASVRSQGFSGQGSAWFGAEQLERFASALAAYPLTEEARAGLAGGYWRDNRLEQVHLAISAYPLDSAGHIGVRVRVATTVSPSDRPQSQHVTEVELQTTYHELELFSRQLREHLAGEREDAVLRADTRT
ncbi:hypothetical protein [Archangium violaceum]|uniref:Uncharacterized protein n=1 Tax=Archangium violaceum Cb vi76 TaxID=1406225 RepID=A0A084SWV3_9BACT|nr:hypothetical protein [Archangium violaceum]KFA92938.1 hypothetical protein Q664_11620 [Archangium violaceum Cb vi76]